MAISISPEADVPARRRALLLWVLAVVAVAAVAVAAFLASRSSWMHARAIEVEGASHLSRAQVVAAARVSLATNVLWLDEDAMERRLEAVPWISAGEVRVALPWTIEISVVERTPVAVASDGLRDVLVAADGTTLGPADGTRGLPRIHLSPSAALGGAVQSARGAALALGAMSPELRARVASVTVLVDGSLELRLRGGLRVRYGGPVEVRRKAELLGRILGWARREGEWLAGVSLVAPGHPAVRLVD